MDKNETLELIQNILGAAAQRLNKDDYEELLYRIQSDCDERLGGIDPENILNLGEDENQNKVAGI